MNASRHPPLTRPALLAALAVFLSLSCSAPGASAPHGPPHGTPHGTPQGAPHGAPHGAAAERGDIEGIGHEAVPPGIEPRVRELLDELVASRSARAKQRFQVVETRDLRDPHGRRIQYHHRYAGSRVLPDRMSLEMRGDLHHAKLWQNPRRLVVLDRTVGTYRELPLDSTPAEIMTAFGGGEPPSPLRHFLHADPVASFLEGVVSGQYLGRRDEYDTPHHHVILSTETVDRQLWIDTGRETRITKFVEAHRTDPGAPRYTLTLEIATSVDLIPDSLFEFEPPEGTRPADDAAAPDEAGGSDTPIGPDAADARDD